MIFRVLILANAYECKGCRQVPLVKGRLAEGEARRGGTLCRRLNHGLEGQPGRAYGYARTAHYQLSIKQF